VETEILTVFKLLSFNVLERFDVVRPVLTGETRDLGSSDIVRGFIHYCYKDTYEIHPVERGASEYVRLA
jgi:hypothetical protein